MLTASLPCSKIFSGNPLNVTIKFTSITVASKDLFKGLSLPINSTHSSFPAPTQICLRKLSRNRKGHWCLQRMAAILQSLLEWGPEVTQPDAHSEPLGEGGGTDLSNFFPDWR